MLEDKRMAPSEPLNLTALEQVWTSLEGRSGILRLAGSLGSGDLIIEHHYMTALRLKRKMIPLNLAALLLLDAYLEPGGEFRFYPDDNPRPQQLVGLAITDLKQQLERWNAEMKQGGLRIPDEYAIFAVKNANVSLEADLKLLWQGVSREIENGRSVGEMIEDLGYPSLGLRVGLAKLRQLGVIHKLTPTFDFDLNFSF
jgi:hypothetical protein